MIFQKNTLIIALIFLSAPVFAERNPQDPYEGYNRFMFKVNDKADHYVMTPVAKGYRAVTPAPVRTGVSNFFNNLRDVISFGSNVLRLDLKRASEDLVRVGVNTTFGVGGLINIADAGGIPNNKNTLGDTFASWGWKNSHYFVYPLTGPSTVRDALGSTITSAALPVDNYIFKETGARIGEKALNAISQREQYLDLTASLDEAAIDKYAAVRDVYMSVRARQIGLTPQQSGEDIDIDELVPDDNTTPAAPTTTPQTESIHLNNGETVSSSDYQPIQ